MSPLRESMETFLVFMFKYGLPVWLDHWDIISKVYAGTGALKTYFTSREVALDDMKKSVSGRLKNSWFDGARQVRRDHTWMIIPTYPLPRTCMIL